MAKKKISASLGRKTSQKTARQTYSVSNGFELTNAGLAYAELKRRILENYYPAGMMVPLQDLSRDLNMSRTPLREALVRLEKERLAQIVPRHGFRILPMSPSEILEIYQIIAGLEAVAIELLTRHSLSAQEEHAFQDNLRQLETTLASHELVEWRKADTNFHQLLLETAGNERLIQEVDRFREQTTRAHKMTLMLRPTPVRSTINHRRLFEAMRTGDLTLAREIHWEQRLGSAKEISDILTKLGMGYL